MGNILFILDMGLVYARLRTAFFAPAPGHCVGMSMQTRSLRSCGYIRSRSASELLLAQKAELPRLSTVCSGDPDAPSTEESRTMI
jgi:hypothetical protein